tara:strand:- start:320 stop:868 length:549 start_codon:yes stop_codon:yes gene_type:complete
MELRHLRQISPDAITKIDFSDAKEYSELSVDEKREYAGNWEAAVENDALKITVSNILKGDVDSVGMPNSGWTWHTHPRGCDNLKNCSIIPPSASDFKQFARKNNDWHMVLSKKRIYWIKPRRKYSQKEETLIENFFGKLEEHFGSGKYQHDQFDEIFTLALKLSNFFDAFKFKNKKIVFISE